MNKDLGLQTLKSHEENFTESVMLQLDQHRCTDAPGHPYWHTDHSGCTEAGIRLGASSFKFSYSTKHTKIRKMSWGLDCLYGETWAYHADQHCPFMVCALLIH